MSSKLPDEFEVIVGNIGKVYDGHNERDARKEFNDWVRNSKAKHGRGSGESVVLFKNLEILKEHTPLWPNWGDRPDGYDGPTGAE